MHHKRTQVSQLALAAEEIEIQILISQPEGDLLHLFHDCFPDPRHGAGNVTTGLFNGRKWPQSSQGWLLCMHASRSLRLSLIGL